MTTAVAEHAEHEEAPESDAAASRFSWTRRFLRQEAGGSSFRFDVQGLRAVAVLLVLAFHLRLPVPGGLVGVDIFFVISGFIITGALVKELTTEGHIDIPAFYARRARRLLPATVVVLTGILVLTLLFIPATRWRGIAYDLLASTFYVQNWRLAGLATDYQAQDVAPSPLQHFWSLAVEEQFYLLWPALILLATLIPRARYRRRARGHSPRVVPTAYTSWLITAMIIVAAPSLAWSIYYTASNPNAAYFVTTTRLWELAAGAGVAIAAHMLASTPRVLAAAAAWAGLAVAIGSAFVITSVTPFPGTAALWPVLGTAVVIAFGPAAGRAGPAVLLALKPMVWIGGISYSLYLWHWPLIVAWESQNGEIQPVGAGIVLLGSVALSYATLRLVENPVRFAPRLAERSASGLTLGAFCMVGGLFCSLVIFFTQFPAPPPAATTTQIQLDEPRRGDRGADTGPLGARVLAAQPLGDRAGAPVDEVDSITPPALSAAQDLPNPGCVGPETTSTPRPCVYGDPDGEQTMVLIGDSHAAQWTPALDAIAQDRGWRMLVYAMQNCMFVDGVTPERLSRPYEACADWTQNVLDEVAGQDVGMAVIAAQQTGYYTEDDVLRPASGADPELVEAFARPFDALQDLGAKVVAIADTPYPTVDVPGCVAENENRLTECAFASQQEGTAGGWTNQSALDAAAQADDEVTYIDLSGAICPTEQCAAVIGDVLVYRDTNHLTATYAGTLAPRLDDQIPQLR